MWQTEENRVSGKDTNLELIPSASVTDALIRQKGNMLFCNASSYLKPLLLNFADCTWVTSRFPLETTKKQVYLFKLDFNRLGKPPEHLADCGYNNTQN